MKLAELLNLQVNKALNIKYEEGSATATLSNVPITLEQAEILIRNMGWIEHRLNAFEIINKTNKFITGLKKVITSDDIWNNTEVQFQNIRSNTYGKTFDRIVLFHPMKFHLVIIYGMESAGAKYAIYESGKAIPVEKCKSLKKVAEFINGRYS